MPLPRLVAIMISSMLLTAFSRSVSTKKTPSMSAESSILPSFVSLLRMLAF